MKTNLAHRRADGRGDRLRRPVDGRVGQHRRAAARRLDVVQAVVRAVRRRVVLANERVRVGRRVRRGAPLLHGARFAVVVAQVVVLERLGERELLRVPDAELLAQRHHGVERLDAKVHATVDEAQVGQLHPQRLVHGREVEHGVGLHAVLVERRPSPRQPAVARRPPERVIRPIQRDICQSSIKCPLTRLVKATYRVNPFISRAENNRR